MPDWKTAIGAIPHAAVAEVHGTVRYRCCLSCLSELHIAEKSPEELDK